MIMEVPDGTFEESLGIDTDRVFPSLECLNKRQISEVKNRVNKIINFHSKSKLAFQAVNFVSNWISEYDFEKKEIFDDTHAKK
jgi:hypothetical protein